MEEIKVGDYIRINGIIGKVEQIGNSLFWLEDGSSYSLSDKKIKHSKNIIDLIEIGDYVNGYRIDNIINGVLVNNEVGLDRSGVLTPIVQYEQDIKTILTHEQFEQNYYKLDLK